MEPPKEKPRWQGEAGRKAYRKSSKSLWCRQIDFAIINSSALAVLQALLQRWLPDGMCVGNEYKARNPTRNDNNPGSFSVNLNTGKWADFATGDKGGDVISLAAYLSEINQYTAAIKLAAMLGVNHE